VQWTEEQERAEGEASGAAAGGSDSPSVPSTPAAELKGGVGKSGPLIQPAGE